MEKLYDLREMLCRELNEYGKKDKLDAGSLDAIDKLAHAIKNLDKVIEHDEDMSYSNRAYEGMSNRSYGGSYRRGMSRRSYMNGYSAAGEDAIEELRSIMDSSDDRTRMKLARVMHMMEQM